MKIKDFIKEEIKRQINETTDYQDIIRLNQNPETNPLNKKILDYIKKEFSKNDFNDIYDTEKSFTKNKDMALIATYQNILGRALGEVSPNGKKSKLSLDSKHGRYLLSQLDKMFK